MQQPQHTPRQRAVAAFWATLLLGWSVDLQAQVVIPPVELPLPTGELTRTVDDAVRTTGGQALHDVRRLEIRALLRTHREVLEADPRGAPIVRNEVTALSPTPAALELAQSVGFSVGRTRTLEALDVKVVVLHAPPGMSTRRALQRLRSIDPQGVYDFNHLYTQTGSARPSPTAHPFAPLPTPTLPTSSAYGRAKVGLIDGGVHVQHRVFRRATIHTYGCDGANLPSAHGTAVASLIAGESEEFRGAAPGAELYAADVYCGQATGGALDAIAEAFGWLARERTPVINISLVGPPNALLQQVVRALSARGHLIVAAVGNDGPNAPPLYPAAYPEVVAVTAVDARRRVLMEAGRGSHVDLAAPGSDMSAAAIAPAFELIRGTSFAAPIVAGLLAQQLEHIDKQRADAALAALIAQAADFGSRGRDKIYGHGLVGETVRPSQHLAIVSKK